MSVLITHACQYAGPGSVPILLRDFGMLFCHDRSFVDREKARLFEKENEGAVALQAQTPAAIAAKVPLGRLGKPEEVGELIAFLASGRASFVTGQVIDFTGGWP
ncbi:MAG TPA: SDR family oxidoreductase [Rhodocyclaceae bacterium]|jgi:NAD(P)-dependent dehydrogenase (short-subunit alcohol dehydrogenase family)|nr:SDR family oxidoreductase [Rhodocyclaceae bacterium]HNE42693.1 SDR family oxidoreductase [Rhodocyclaceae bacterium]HNM20979.1 SDR family oxidoreductase [Rhodocyclaceae bacterium]HNM80671.1 SDR family oxidoreductase [Rhodocyclaceae bacterium]